MMFVKLLFLHERNVWYYLRKSEYLLSWYVHVPTFPHRIYRWKTKPACTILTAHALFHHIISFILEALRHWTNKSMHYYRAIKYLYCSLKPYFRDPSSNVAYEFLMEGTVRVLIARFNCQFCMLFCTKWWPIDDYYFTSYISMIYRKNEISFC